MIDAPWMSERYARDRQLQQHEWGRHKRIPDPDCFDCQLNKRKDRNEAAGILTNAIAGIWSPAPAPKGFRKE